MFIPILDILALASVKFNLLILSILPRKISRAYATLFVRTFLFFMPRHKKVAFKNMDIIFPGISTHDKKKLLDENYKIMGENILGFIEGPKLTKKEVEESLNIEGAEKTIQKLQKKDKNVGCLLLIPHLGSFELLSHYWCLYDKPFSIIAREFGLPRFDAWWNKMREANGNEVFSRKGGYKSIIKELKKGRNVALLFDQNVKSNHAMFADFFGMPAATTKSFALASLRTGSPLIIATMVRSSKNEYTLYGEEISPPCKREGSNEQIIHDTIREAHEKLETIITNHPEQWFWIHRRFKTRPQGEPENIY